MSERSLTKRIATAAFIVALTLGVSSHPDVSSPAHAAEAPKPECPPELTFQTKGNERWLSITRDLLAKGNLTLDQAVNRTLTCNPTAASIDQPTIIKIEKGQYTYGKAIRLGSYTTLAGSGINNTLLFYEPNSDDDEAVGVQNNGIFTHIQIRDLSLTGPGNRSKEIDGIKLADTTHANIQSVDVSKFSRDGILLSSGKANKGVDKSSISNCSISHNGRNGISITNGNRNTIEDCSVSYNSEPTRAGDYGVAGIDLEPDSSNSVTNTMVKRNRVFRNGWNGIAAATENIEEGKNTGNIVCDNEIFENGHNGINETTENDRRRPNSYYRNNPQPLRSHVMPKSIISDEIHPECALKTAS